MAFFNFLNNAPPKKIKNKKYIYRELFDEN